MNDRFSEKIDSLDLIITVLRDHEKKLSLLISRLENHVETKLGKQSPYKQYQYGMGTCIPKWRQRIHE